ncbi:gamma carbonic anhydrase family protein [Rhodococcoides trifolii]|uniref:Gamma carbonic anhydrase family protein n=1 Tax=Rhodococcoides trifolii TaxID=908250 RepID=A0A917D1R5_9NOCA|nr:gamma carbonic anhydrase family protein [Rhodococcus trifolii]GGG03401.1 gamma carbonic anhydrase family protein [Rhodococcus trifolii]
MIVGLSNSRNPVIADSAWVAPNATIVGSVYIGENAGVWYSAVIRADSESVSIGDDTNIQDGCVVHADPGSPAVIGSNVSVGHNATLHGCTIGDNVLVGMGAIIMNGATVGRDCLIAAGALLTENVDVPDGSLVAGVPAKIRRDLTAEEIASVRANGEGYVLKRLEHGTALSQKQSGKVG